MIVLVTKIVFGDLKITINAKISILNSIKPVKSNKSVIAIRVWQRATIKQIAQHTDLRKHAWKIGYVIGDLIIILLAEIKGSTKCSLIIAMFGSISSQARQIQLGICSFTNLE